MSDPTTTTTAAATPPPATTVATVGNSLVSELQQFGHKVSDVAATTVNGVGDLTHSVVASIQSGLASLGHTLSSLHVGATVKAELPAIEAAVVAELQAILSKPIPATAKTFADLVPQAGGAVLVNLLPLIALAVVQINARVAEGQVAASDPATTPHTDTAN